MTEIIPIGTVHHLPEDLALVLKRDKMIALLWNGLTPLGRNEWICWVVSAKKSETRSRRIERLVQDLKAGKRRPCCWAGCRHR